MSLHVASKPLPVVYGKRLHAKSNTHPSRGSSICHLSSKLEDVPITPTLTLRGITFSDHHQLGRGKIDENSATQGIDTALTAVVYSGSITVLSFVDSNHVRMTIAVYTTESIRKHV